MERESLKEMLLNIKPGDYAKINTHVITEEDIKDYYNLYSEYFKAKNEYSHLILGRKEKAQELLKTLKLLETMNKLILEGIKGERNYMEDSINELRYAHIKDYSKAFEVLKRLAETDKVKYEIKAIKFPAYDSIERHGYRDTIEYEGEIIILGESETLSKYDFSSSNQYFSKDTLIEIYNHGFSMVLIGNDEYKTDLKLPNKHTIGNYHPIIFYLQDDELANAASKFIKFIEENGPDIEGMEISDLVNIINSKYCKSKKRTKL